MNLIRDHRTKIIKFSSFLTNTRGNYYSMNLKNKDYYKSRAMRKCVLCHLRTSARMRSLISAFVVRCLDSIISLDSIAEISRLASFCS